MARVGGFYSSNYDQWSVYLNSLDQSLENPSLSLSSSSPSSTSTSLPAYSTIQSVYDQFLLSYPYSIHYWFKYINISSSRYQQTHDIIYSLHRRSTQAAPYSPSLWYGRISYLVNWNQISNQSTEIIRSIFEAIEHLSGHPEAVDVWKLILYNIQIYGSILQIFYCYWRGLSSYSSYLSILSDQFTHFIQKINFSFNFSSQQLSLENAPQPTPQEIPFVVLYYSAVNFYVEKKEIRKDSYLQSAPNEFEKQITRRFYEEGMLSQQELGIWHQYLSYEELSCESSENNYLPGSQFADLLTSQTGSNFLQECFHSELDCLILCDRAQSENEVLKEKVKENRKYDRVIQLYERCLLICASYSDIWKRYISWTVRLSQRQNEKKKYYQRALFICHRAISTALRECIPLYTLYGELLEEYHGDGRGHDILLNLYQQKLDTLQQIKNCDETSSSKDLIKACTSTSSQGIDLELVSKTVETKRRQGNHEEALNILSTTYEIAINSKLRCVQTCNTIQIMRSTYISIHLSDHKHALRNLLDYIRNKSSSNNTIIGIERSKSGGYLCKSLSDYLRVYTDDTSLSLVKCCYDILIRYYDIQLYNTRKDIKKNKNNDCIEEEKLLLEKRDQEVCVLLSSAVMMATYSQLTEKPIGFPEEEDVIPSQGLRIEFNVISPPSGTSIGIRGVGVTALAQLFSQYCQSLCSNQEYSLQSQALVETCTRHRQYQYHGNKEIRS